MLATHTHTQKKKKGKNIGWLERQYLTKTHFTAWPVLYYVQHPENTMMWNQAWKLRNCFGTGNNCADQQIDPSEILLQKKVMTKTCLIYSHNQHAAKHLFMKMHAHTHTHTCTHTHTHTHTLQNTSAVTNTHTHAPPWTSTEHFAGDYLGISSIQFVHHSFSSLMCLPAKAIFTR